MQGKGGISSGTIVAILVPISVAVLIFIVFICCLSKRRRNKHDSDPKDESATNNFSVDNMIGKGGSGEVYQAIPYIYIDFMFELQGMLPDGQEIAVKRLYKTESSRRGVEDFKNEVEVNATIKHRNLVRLLGFSVQDDEKILIFEYMPNGGLHNILFGKSIYINSTYARF
ncbi:hypothetical protein K1719_005008 [Acacia pycnantha]|nr:hypothetical protein K1719_005008 [Acacia pycnantha]